MRHRRLFGRLIYIKKYILYLVVMNFFITFKGVRKIFYLLYHLLVKDIIELLRYLLMSSQTESSDLRPLSLFLNLRLHGNLLHKEIFHICCSDHLITPPHWWTLISSKLLGSNCQMIIFTQFSSSGYRSIMIVPFEHFYKDTQVQSVKEYWYKLS